MASIKNNLFYNVINAAISFLFPIITLPYASRILLADGLGQIDFYNSIINYIVLGTSLGIPLYAVREVARTKYDKMLFNKNVIEILLLQTLLSIIGYVIVFILCLTYSKVQENKALFLVLSVYIFLNAVGVQWFYQAIEDFKYIAIRAVIIKSCCILSIFALVKNHDDLILYAVISVAVNIGNAIFNLTRLFKYIDISTIKNSRLNLAKHIKPALKIFMLNLSTSLYNYLNVFLLGAFTCSEIVGYFSTTMKYVSLFLGVTSIISTVLIPRFSSIAHNGTKQEFISLGSRIYNLVLMVVIPLAIGTCILSEPLILTLCGPTFERSVNVMRLVCFNIALIGVSSMFGLQFLFPQGKESIVIKSTLLGALTNIVLNILLIPRLFEMGSAIATVSAETVVAVAMTIMGRKYLPVTIINNSVRNILLSAGSMAIMTFSVNFLRLSNTMHLFVGFTISVFTYILILLVLRDDTFIYLLNQVKKNNTTSK